MENKKTFIINTLYYALIFALAYVFCNYLFGILAPFVIGFIFAYFAVRFTKNVFKKETKVLRVVSLVIIYAIVISVLVILAILGINEIIDFIASIPNLYKQYVEPVLQGFSSDINLRNSNLPIDIQVEIKDILNNLLDSIKSLVSSISSAIVTSGSALISNTTSIIIAVLTTLITSFFVVYDYEDIMNYLEKFFNGLTKNLYSEVKNYCVNTVFLVIRSYGLIMFITFVELLIGLLILGVENFALIAMIVAVLDILPVLGVGTVLIPWGIFELIVGKYPLGIGLLVLYIIITLVRNVIEPKFVGANLDLHPLAALFSMLIGLNLFGVLGMFGLPLLISFLIKRNNEKTIK